MATTVKERIKTELEQVKVEGKQRATRIGDILKDAASMSFGEIKEGSSNLNVSARQSIAEILEELNETAKDTTDTTHETVATSTADVESDTTKAAPSWKIIVGHALEIVRNRKGDWFQALKEYLAENAGKLDQELTTQHGDRYLKVRQVLNGIASRLKATQAKAKWASEADTNYSQPINAEIVDTKTSADSTTVHRIDPEA